MNFLKGWMEKRFFYYFMRWLLHYSFWDTKRNSLPCRLSFSTWLGSGSKYFLNWFFTATGSTMHTPCFYHSSTRHETTEDLSHRSKRTRSFPCRNKCRVPVHLDDIKHAQQLHIVQMLHNDKFRTFDVHF